MKTSTLYIIFLCAGLAISSCHCKDKKKPCTDPSNPDCENYDPCHGKKAPSAEFIIGQSSNQSYFGMGSYEFVSDDTLFALFYWPITFLAKEEGAEYEWKLGSETIEAKRFTRSFGSAGYGRYVATLTIRKEVDNTCFPEYTGEATLTRYFEIRPFHEFPIVGKYRVLFEGETDSTEIQIQPWEMRRSPQTAPWNIVDNKSEKELTLINFSNGRSARADTMTHISTDMLFSGNKLYTNRSPVDNSNIELREGKYITAEYTLIYPPNPGSGNQYFPGIKFSGIKIE